VLDLGELLGRDLHIQASCPPQIHLPIVLTRPSSREVVRIAKQILVPPPVVAASVSDAQLALFT
jgi:hypothetical protein